MGPVVTGLYNAQEMRFQGILLIEFVQQKNHFGEVLGTGIYYSFVGSE